MADICPSLGTSVSYKDRRYDGTDAQWTAQMATSTTLYVGNLAFFTTEEQIHQLFSKCGQVKRIIMGLDKYQKTPCGFCFCEFYERKDAIDCVMFVSGTKLDDRTIRADIDPAGRQYGRGKHGGQVRDEHRDDFDAGRGGWSFAEKEKSEYDRTQDQAQKYDKDSIIPDGAQTAYYTKGHTESSRGGGARGKRDRREDDSDEEDMGRDRKRA